MSGAGQVWPGAGRVWPGHGPDDHPSGSQVREISGRGLGTIGAREGGMVAVHLVARLRSDRVDLRAPNVAPVVWRILRKRFPDALITELMPNHPHLMTPSRDPEQSRRELANACGRIQYALGWPAGSWQPIPPPRVITKRAELRRQYRYVALNECRANLAGDPLEALWSTYREMVGAVVDPWVEAELVLRMLGAPRRDPVGWLHGFVSGDPSVRVSGTPLPRPARNGPLPTVALGNVLRASAAAMRSQAELVRSRGRVRDAFVWLANETGWGNAAWLAKVCGITPTAVRTIARNSDPAIVKAASLCLGDERLLRRTPLPGDLVTRFFTAQTLARTG